MSCPKMSSFLHITARSSNPSHISTKVYERQKLYFTVFSVLSKLTENDARAKTVL